MTSKTVFKTGELLCLLRPPNVLQKSICRLIGGTTDRIASYAAGASGNLHSRASVRRNRIPRSLAHARSKIVLQHIHLQDRTLQRSAGWSAMVKSRMGAVAWGQWPAPRFPSPLIEPDVPVSGIRLSDWLHRKAHGVARQGRRSRRSRPSSPWTTSKENRRVPRPATLCRRARKSRTRS